MWANAPLARLHPTGIVIVIFITLLVSLVSFPVWSLLVSFVIVQYCWRWDLYSELDPPEFQAWKEPYEKSSVLVLTVCTCILTYNLVYRKQTPDITTADPPPQFLPPPTPSPPSTSPPPPPPPLPPSDPKPTVSDASPTPAQTTQPSHHNGGQTGIQQNLQGQQDPVPADIVPAPLSSSSQSTQPPILLLPPLPQSQEHERASIKSEAEAEAGAEEQEESLGNEPTVLATTPAGHDHADQQQQRRPDEVEGHDETRAVSEALRPSRAVPQPQRNPENTCAHVMPTTAASSSSKAVKHQSSIPIPISSSSSSPRGRRASPDTGGGGGGARSRGPPSAAAEAASTPDDSPLAALAATDNHPTPEAGPHATASAAPAAPSPSSSSPEAAAPPEETPQPTDPPPSSDDREDRNQSSSSSGTTTLERLLQEFEFAGPRVQVATEPRPEEEKRVEQEMLEEDCLAGTACAQVEPIRIDGTEAWYQADRLKVWVGYNRHLSLWTACRRWPRDFPRGYVLVGGMTEEQVRSRGARRTHKDKVEIW